MNPLSEENSLFNSQCDLGEHSDIEFENIHQDFSDLIFGPESEDLAPFEGAALSGSSELPTRRNAASNRKNKKDDFDYSNYIRTEMVRSKATELEPSVQKRMIQKIRNRMSAQRSRQRQKSMLGILEQENQELKCQNIDLFRRLTESQRECAALKEQLQASKKSASTSDNEDTISQASSEVVRECRAASFAGRGNVFLVVVAVLAVCLLPMTGGGDGGNAAVKMGGIVPFSAPTTKPSNLSIASYCRKYCRKEDAPQLAVDQRAVQLYGREEEEEAATAAARLPSSQKDTSTLVCFDPRSKGSYREAFRVLVDNHTFSYLDPAHSYYGAFSRVDSPVSFK